MLAARRNERVRGRTLILMVSIITKNGFSQCGAPPGRSLAAQLEVLYTIADRIKASHNGRPNLSVNNKWLENLKTAGSSPNKLILMIIMNSLTSRILNPFMWAPVVRLLWSFIIFIVVLERIKRLVGVAHNDRENIITDVKVMLQNIIGDSKLLIKLTPGSKEEKISSIIKTWECPVEDFEGL